MGVYIKGMKVPEDCVTCKFHKSLYCTLTDICTNSAQGCPLIEVPTSDVRENRHGYWYTRKVNGEDLLGLNFCSNCGEWSIFSKVHRNKFNFCPNCGARMDGETE